MKLQKICGKKKRNVIINLAITRVTLDQYLKEVTSPEYFLGEHIICCLKIDSIYNSTSSGFYYFMVHFKATYRSDTDSNQKIILSSKALNVNCKVDVTGQWQLISNKTSTTNHIQFQVSASLDDITEPMHNPFSEMHDDTELTDFELRSEDGGSVLVHKVVLAASCPILKGMLTGEWKENKQGHMVIPGVDKTTLQQFKDYMYTFKLPETGILKGTLTGEWKENKQGHMVIPGVDKTTLQQFKDYMYTFQLPETGAENLLQLASMYLMTELEKKCIETIVDSVTPDNVIEIILMCGRNNLKNVLLKVLQCIDQDMMDCISGKAVIKLGGGS